jgi:prophage tail gpP-like protein
MPNPQEIATIVANGLTYAGWTSVQIERRYPDSISHMRLEIAEHSSGRNAGGARPLNVRDQAQGYLGGRLVISGMVTVRQVSYDKDQHAVQVVVSSQTVRLSSSTVDGTPGFYQNSTLAQIAQAVASKVGVGFQMQGSPSGADKPFPRVSEHIGETRFDFLSRLSTMRNLYLRDDGKGSLIATRGVGGVSAALIEGKNIKSANLTLRDDEFGNPVRVVGDNFAGSLTTIDDNEARNVSATVTSPNVPPDRPETVGMPHPGDNQDAAMYAARVAAWNIATYVDGQIIVPGWFLDNGDLWIEHVGDLVSINSPMLLPSGAIALAIKGVVHRQDSESGTETVIEVCDPGALGSTAVQSTGADAPGAFPSVGTPQPGQ